MSHIIMMAGGIVKTSPISAKALLRAYWEIQAELIKTHGDWRALPDWQTKNIRRIKSITTPKPSLYCEGEILALPLFRGPSLEFFEGAATLANGVLIKDGKIREFMGDFAALARPRPNLRIVE